MGRIAWQITTRESAFLRFVSSPMIAVPALVKLLPKVLLAGALLRRSASVAPAAASAALMRPARAGPSDEGSAVQALREALTASGLGDASLWGVPLTGESGAPLLRQFLRARRWCVDDARRMLQGTLRWRRENRVDELSSMSNFGEGMPLDKIIGKAGAGPLVLATLPGRAVRTRRSPFPVPDASVAPRL